MSRILFVIMLCMVAIPACEQITTWKDVTPSLGEYKLYTTITVIDDMCLLDGREVNGWTKYNTQVRSISEICVSLRSDDPQRTLQHELDHAWRNAVGLDAQEMNP